MNNTILWYFNWYHFDFSGEYYLGYTKFELQGVSWYNLLHPDCMKEVQSKHRQSKYWIIFAKFRCPVLFNWIVKLLSFYTPCYNRILKELFCAINDNKMIFLGMHIFSASKTFIACCAIKTFPNSIFKAAG